MRSGHVGFFEAEEQVTVQVRIALGVDEERVADAALSMGNVFMERERSRSSGSPLAAPAPLPNRPASIAAPPSARVTRIVTRVSVRRRTVPLPAVCRPGASLSTEPRRGRTMISSTGSSLITTDPGRARRLIGASRSVKLPANDLHRCRAMNGPHTGSCTGRSKACTRPGIAHQRPHLASACTVPKLTMRVHAGDPLASDRGGSTWQRWASDDGLR
jgi:hypothetical protein